MNYFVTKLKLTLLLLLLNVLFAAASKVDTLKVKSQSMDKFISNIVILPDTYSTQNEKFAVLYLLHGASGNHKDWVTKVPAVKQYADKYNFIIVCPDGSNNSWYFDSPVDEQMKYETYVAKELVDAVDAKYNTLASREKRAITGLSMGGHGAFYLAFRNQDVWGAAGSMSGGLDIRPFPKNWSLPERLGSYAEFKDNWEKNTVINLVYLLKGDNLKLMFDCGTDDFFYDANNRMHQKLLERNIPHDYIQRPGKHNWPYWSNAIAYQSLYFYMFFNL